MAKRHGLTLLIIFVTVVAVSVYYTADTKRTNSGMATPSVVRVGVLPEMSESDLRQRYEPLLQYLSKQTSFEYTLVVPADYAELLRLFGTGEIDLALFGGATFVQANDLHQAQPLVMRDVDTRFISVFLVRHNDPATEVSDLKDRVLAFGSSLSTSGHLMPRYFLQQNKRIIPENFFGQVVYSGAHDKTAYMVRDGEADIGAVNAEIVNCMLRDGRLKQGDLRVVWQTPPYPNYVWAVPQHLNEDIKTKLRDAYLQLDYNDEHHRQILAGIGATSFLPAGIRQFQPLQQIAADLELLGTE
ncbi:MAG: phosphate/phosphite/phosphonate ABC transporter substrate-binding protein [Gammaproteobacteria bacterium]|nr:phosphate/phosphite/phosphonate ABC transporter substrate-binding protein [Gammaproteobacteria bacterium]